MLRSLASSFPALSAYLIYMDVLQLAAALSEVTDGASIRSISKQYHISRHYLTRRFNLLPVKARAQEYRQVLTVELERELADWALTQSRLGWSPPHSRFRIYAQSLLEATGSDHRLGKRWHLRFFKRWPQLKTLRSRGMDFQRVNGACRENLEEFFARLALPRVEEVLLENTWNIDEVGCQIGLGDSPLVIGPSALNEVFTIDPGLSE